MKVAIRLGIASRIILTIIILICLHSICFADNWPSGTPKREVYYSSNRQYRFEVLPGQHCRGILFRSHSGKTPHKLWESKLINSVSPYDVFVPDDGNYVVTFDNFNNVGYGSDVIVIYTKGGRLIRSLALEDILTANELSKIPISISSRWWHEDKNYYTYTDGILTLRVIQIPWWVAFLNQLNSIWGGEGGDRRQIIEMSIKLSTGRVLR